MKFEDSWWRTVDVLIPYRLYRGLSLRHHRFSSIFCYDREFYGGFYRFIMRPGYIEQFSLIFFVIGGFGKLSRFIVRSTHKNPNFLEFTWIDTRWGRFYWFYLAGHTLRRILMILLDWLDVFTRILPISLESAQIRRNTISLWWIRPNYRSFNLKSRIHTNLTFSVETFHSAR